jgi:hypothetical protein
MSTTCTALISMSLRKLGVLRETETATAEQAAGGLAQLNLFLASLHKDGIDLGAYPVSLSAAIPLEDWAVLPVAYNLAILLAPDYGATVSSELAAMATSGMRLLEKAQVKPRTLSFDQLPTGMGAYYNIYTDEGA